MKVTSDTLFHFTTSLKNIEGILLKKFQLTYCHEKYQLDYQTHDSYYPMISFCDIPLSLAKDHIERYGAYAIGMTKEWGVNNNLNPVVYIDKESLLAKDVQSSLDNMQKTIDSLATHINNETLAFQRFIINSLNKTGNYLEHKSPDYMQRSRNIELAQKELQDTLEYANRKKDSSKDRKVIIENLSETINNNENLFRYIKNYEGTLNRNDKTIPKYRFYDEREWRYVPAFKNSEIKAYLNIEQYKQYRGSSKTKPFIENINLPFTGNDIKYLIVKSSKDIPKLIKTIKGIDNLTKNPNEADVLTTKILTVEQINNDF